MCTLLISCVNFTDPWGLSGNSLIGIVWIDVLLTMSQRSSTELLCPNFLHVQWGIAHLMIATIFFRILPACQSCVEFLECLSGRVHDRFLIACSYSRRIDVWESKSAFIQLPWRQCECLTFNDSLSSNFSDVLLIAFLWRV